MAFSFNKNSRMVQDMLLLIDNGTITLKEVPDVANLQEVVKQCLKE